MNGWETLHYCKSKTIFFNIGCVQIKEHMLFNMPCPRVITNDSNQSIVEALSVQSHTWVLACLNSVSFRASDSTEVLKMSFISYGSSPALWNSMPLGKPGRGSRSNRPASSSIYLCREREGSGPGCRQGRGPSISPTTT